MIRISRVHPESLAAELGLVPGAELLSINGRSLEDFLDWEYLAADERFLLLARMPAGDAVEFDIERPEGMPLGVELEPPRIRRCANRCDFCFVDGNPHGMREALYIRDDDYRLSFRYGNFATLTNLKPKDVDRIIEYRLSPLYVSVHATDPVVRRRLLRNPRAPDIVPQLREFAEAGIQYHTQIVLQPGVNDGAVLTASLEDLYALGAPVLSVSVVPVGLTEYSKHHLVREPTARECRDAIAVLESLAGRARAERGHHWAYGADELYLRAEVALPPEERYDGFEQVENGVGAVRYLQRLVRDLDVDLRGARIGVLTGVAMGGLMPHVLELLQARTGGSFRVVVIRNDLFGPSVTTAGLLPGRALRAALQDARAWMDIALIPGEAVNDAGQFMDDLTLDDVRESGPVDVRPSVDFVDALQPQSSLR